MFLKYHSKISYHQNNYSIKTKYTKKYNVNIHKYQIKSNKKSK